MISEQLALELKKIRKRKRIPALGAAAYINGEFVEMAVDGRRKVGSDEPVSITDKWHIGSCTKPMTSTLAGVLIGQGRIDWDTTIADVFQDWRGEIKNEWGKATLEQLLSHHGGACTSLPPSWWRRVFLDRNITPLEQRLNLVHDLLSEKPEAAPGSKFIYSNLGYAIAGVMLEKCSGQPWEDLMYQHVFQPLGMSSAGFGAPGIPNLIDQPYGHVKLRPTSLSPIEPGLLADNPPAIGPAGTVHCSIQDLLKFAASHAGENSLVDQNILSRLHHRFGESEYSAGWSVLERAWGDGLVLNHNGSNTYWFATMWVAPLTHSAFVAVSNAPSGQQACFEAVNWMITHHH